MNYQGPHIVYTPDGSYVRDDNAPAAGLTPTDSSDQEPKPDDAEKPAAITSQPPSYEEVMKGEHVVKSQPV
jgi:hypothetical protein